MAFAGDALLCLFSDKSQGAGASNESLQDCCVRAVNCAHALVEVQTDMLTSHIAISCGEMFFSSLGGFKYEWTWVLGGIDDATSKQVVVTEEVYTYLTQIAGNTFHTEKTVGGNYRVQACDSLSTMLELRNRFAKVSSQKMVVRSARQFVPRPVLHAIKYGTLDTISELRYSLSWTRTTL